MKLLLTIDSMDNDAFEVDGVTVEVARILHNAARTIDENYQFAPGYSFPLRDMNGNKVGYLSILED